jgi:hypothetical protein
MFGRYACIYTREKLRDFIYLFIILSGLVVSDISVGLTVRWFIPCRGRVIKICSMTSIGWEVKSSAPCCKILRHVK